jgi:hypothetical protein
VFISKKISTTERKNHQQQHYNNVANAVILHGVLVRIEWSVESGNAFKDEGFDSIQSLNNVTQLNLKTMCKSIRSTPDPGRIGFHQEYKLYTLHSLVITWLSHEQIAQGQQFTDAIALKYAVRVFCFKESKKDDDEELMKLSYTFGKETSWMIFKRC